MKTRKFNVLIVMLAVILMSFSYQVNAQMNKKGPGHGWKQQNNQARDHHIPNLTEDQQKKIEKMRTANMKEMMQFRNVMAENRAHLNTLRTADKVDMNAIDKQIDEIGANKTKMMKKREAHHQSIRQLLTDDQRVYFDSHQGRGLKGGKGHGRSGGMHGQGCGGY